MVVCAVGRLEASLHVHVPKLIAKFDEHTTQTLLKYDMLYVHTTLHKLLSRCLIQTCGELLFSYLPSTHSQLIIVLMEQSRFINVSDNTMYVNSFHRNLTLPLVERFVRTIIDQVAES
jgi:hypothetical protein